MDFEAMVHFSEDLTDSDIGQYRLHLKTPCFLWLRSGLSRVLSLSQTMTAAEMIFFFLLSADGKQDFWNKIRNTFYCKEEKRVTKFLPISEP